MTVNITLKALVQGAYDVQKLRVGIGNRITQCFYQAHGVAPGAKPDEEMEEKDLKVLKKIKDEWRHLATGIRESTEAGKFKPIPKKGFTPTQYLPEHVITQLCRIHEGLERQEILAFKDVEIALRGIPVYDQYLKSVTGCGPAMAGVMLSCFDIEKAVYPSQFWSYAGLDVGPDGRGRSRRKEHLVTRKYVNRDGKEEERLGITFNPFLKTKLLGVLAGCFLRNNNPYYRGIYDNYKHRLETDPARADWTPGRRNNAAKRYMVKQFLADFWREWRTIEGLPTVPTYHEAKQGHVHHQGRAA